MIKNILPTLFALFFAATLQAQDTYHTELQTQLQSTYGLPAGSWVFADSEAANLATDFSYGSVTVTDAAAPGQDFSQKVTLDVNLVNGPQWNSAYGLNSQSAVNEGDRCLLVIWLRSAGQAGKVSLAVQNGTTFTSQLYLTVDLTSEWKRYLLPFELSESLTANNLQLAVQLNWLDQIVELGGVNILNYGTAVELEELPVNLNADYYEGQAPDAPWRAEAALRIDEYRKADLSIEVLDNTGSPLSNVPVAVRMLEHEYEFGTAVAAHLFAGNSQQNNTYEDRLLDLDGNGHRFNSVVFENATKWVAWENNWFGVSQADKVNTIQWLAGNDIPVRGHTLIWPSWQNLPDDLENNQGDPDYLHNRVMNHLETMLTSPGLQGAFTDWDVLNEISVLNDLADAMKGAPGYPTGREIYVDIFERFAELAPDVPSVLNDYTVFGAGSSDGATADLKQYVAELQSAGVEIDYIGFQGHIGIFPTSIPEVYDILEDFHTSFGTGAKITEFDMKPETEEQTAAEYLRDFYTICFSHPSTDAILMWGFWDGAHWFDNAPLFEEDWSLKPSGQAYFDLVYNEWWTEEEDFTDGAGSYSLRGFKGRYEVTVNCDGQIYTDTLMLVEDTQWTINCSDLVSVNGPNDLPRLRVFPNPATDQLQLDWSAPGPATAVIYDVLGREVHRQAALQSPAIIRPSLVPGRYSLVLITAAGNMIEPLLIR